MDKLSGKLSMFKLFSKKGSDVCLKKLNSSFVNICVATSCSWPHHRVASDVLQVRSSFWGAKALTSKGYVIGILTKKGILSNCNTALTSLWSWHKDLCNEEHQRGSTRGAEQMHRCTEEHKRICSATVSLFVNLGHLDKQAAQEITIPSKSSRQRFSEARQGPRQQVGWGTWLGPPCYRWRRWGHLRPPPIQSTCEWTPSQVMTKRWLYCFQSNIVKSSKI